MNPSAIGASYAPIVDARALEYEVGDGSIMGEAIHAPGLQASDLYSGRTDVAGFEEVPRYFFLPFLKKIEVIHPKAFGDVSTRSVIVLDLDEVASAAAGSGSGGEAVIAESLLLGGAGFLALWFGTRTSILEFIETTKALKELSEEKKEILLASAEAFKQSMSSEAFSRLQSNFAALLVENKNGRHEAKVSRIFSGVVGGVGATAIGVGTFMEVPLYTTAAVAAAGATLLTVAAPIISVFALGVAGQQAYRCYKTRAVGEALEKLMDQPKLGKEDEVYELLKQRISLVRKVTVARSTSMVLMAVGAPLTIFGGPYGLAVLLPGVIGGIVSAYIDTRKLSYGPQLTWEEKARIDGRSALVNAIDAAHNEYAQLKRLKSQQRLLYPIGASAPQPFKAVAKVAAWARRKLKGNLGYDASEQTFFAYLRERGAQEIQALQNVRESVQRELDTLFSQQHYNGQVPQDARVREAELVQKRERIEEQITELAQEALLLDRELEQPLLDDESVFCLLRHFIKTNLFSNLSECILEDRHLKKTLLDAGVITKDGKEFHLDANQLVLFMSNESPWPSVERTKLRESLFKIAKDTLFTAAKNRAQWRERQLLDFLAIHLTI